MILILCAVISGWLAPIAHADIVYQVRRTIGAGTITGYIVTDGTIGFLSSDNILYWELSLGATNLAGGSPDNMRPHTEQAAFISGPMLVTATPTSLIFDISGNHGLGYIYFEGESDNFWCIETVFADCTGAGKGEHMGRSSTGNTVAQTAHPTGSFVFASVVAPIEYQVNRTIGSGTVTGFIKTDGTTGTLTAANILDWKLTLNAPNLSGGPTDTIELATQGGTTITGPLLLTATPRELVFDITGHSGIGFLLFQGGDNNFWCLETVFADCTGAGKGEHIGFGTGAAPVAQTANPTGHITIASVREPILYHVNRTIGAGTVTGFIETDGSLGVITGANIINWELTLSAPNLTSGSPNTIRYAQSLFSKTTGLPVTATPTSLFFDILGNSGIGSIIFQGNNHNFWCIETVFANCTGTGKGEHMGIAPDAFVAQTGQPVGNFPFANVCLADVTGDGSLDFFDISAFIGQYSTGNLAADFTGDGLLDFFDIAAFIAEYSNGCP